jgi:protein-S-isoprenylcysteine O-methyltransferase Ste14
MRFCWVWGKRLAQSGGDWFHRDLAASLVFTRLALRTQTEERCLIERFGDQYRDYVKGVGGFCPSGVRQDVITKWVLNNRETE